MPPINKVGDQKVCVATSDYPHAKWGFELFNPVQSRVMDFYNEDCNSLIAASTSAGKTVVAEMFLADEVRRRGGKGMFLAPLRALAREKSEDWKSKSHHFGDLKVSICTGDFRLTKDRTAELNDADLIIMTSEMLSHRSRSHGSEQSSFLKEVGTLVVDESHLLTVPGRGDHLEVGLMTFTRLQPGARLILLSATMPNVDQIAEWVSYSLNGKKTFVLESKYRPVPLTTHYEHYADDLKRYDLLETEKINKAMDIVEYYPEDKFLIFAHTKRTGDMMKRELQSAGIQCEFHNADLDSAARARVEDKFKKDPAFRVIVATSTLAWGLNMPARRVIILGVHRGVEEVESHDIIQMVGRSGRYGIDPMGDAYILVPESKVHEYKQKYSQSRKIQSQLLSISGSHHKTLAFHLVSAIFQGEVSTVEDVHKWFERSLAHFQSLVLNHDVVDSTVELLTKCGAIGVEDGKLFARPVGRVSAMFYVSPFDVSSYYFNFRRLFEGGFEADDVRISFALANIDSNRTSIVSKAEKEEMDSYLNKLRPVLGGSYVPDGVVKAGFCYYALMNGVNASACSSTQRGIQADFNRVSQIIQTLGSLSTAWSRQCYFSTLETRISSGAPAHLLDLCRLPGIGKARATKLYDQGVRNVADISGMTPEALSKAANLKVDVAKELIRVSQGL